MQPYTKFYDTIFDWSGMEDRKGKQLCCVCMPTRFRDGTVVEEAGRWHGQFPRMFLPKGQFKTGKQGSLEHIATGSTDLKSFELPGEEGTY